MSGLKAISRIVNTPLLISQAKLDILMSDVVLKVLAGAPLASLEKDKKQANEQAGKIAIIPVFDSLVAKNGTGDSGFTSYEFLRARTLGAINSGFTHIGYYVDSPGGEVSGAFSFANFLASLKSQGIRTFAISDGSMTSGAYLIGAATDKIYLTSEAHAGSIAVLYSHVDISKAAEKDGKTYTLISSKPKKTLGNPYEPLSEESKTFIEGFISEIDLLFNEFVSNNRNISVESIVAMEGAIFGAQQAMELGLADAVVTSYDEALALEMKMAVENQILNSVGSTLDAGEVQKQIKVAVEAERDRCIKIIDAAQTLGINSNVAKRRILAGTSVEDSLEILTAIAEAADAKITAETSAASTSAALTPSVNPAINSAPKMNVGGIEISKADLLQAAGVAV